MGQREEDLQWDVEREAERRGFPTRRPPSKYPGEMQADWAVDAMRNRQLETYAAGLAHADGLGGVQDIPADQFGTIVEADACWVLQRNDFPHTVYASKQEADTACADERRKDAEWREENKHVADVRVFWNVYPAKRK